MQRDIEIERKNRSGKTVIDGVANKRRTIIAKFLNFKDKQQVLSEYKARKLWTKGIFINEDFSEDTMEKRKGLFQRTKELREEVCQGAGFRVWIHSETVRDMTTTYSQMHRTDNYSEHSSIIWSVWPNG